MLTMDNLVGYKGDVTNDQADCGLVFVAQAKDGQVDAVKAELEAYKESLSANDLYAEFADKIALAKDARIVTNGNYVAIVIAGIANSRLRPHRHRAGDGPQLLKDDPMQGPLPFGNGPFNMIQKEGSTPWF